MPIPKPKKGEKRNDFIVRCMSNPTMIAEYPDYKQRNAVCNTSYEGDKTA